MIDISVPLKALVFHGHIPVGGRSGGCAAAV